MTIRPATALFVLAFDPHASRLVLHLGLRIFGAAAFCRVVKMRADFLEVGDHSMHSITMSVSSKHTMARIP
jgi:hypothetical protein